MFAIKQHDKIILPMLRDYKQARLALGMLMDNHHVTVKQVMDAGYTIERSENENRSRMQ